MSKRSCLRCLERFVRVAALLSEAGIHIEMRDFERARRAVDTAKIELDGMVRRYECLDRETYDSMIHDIQTYLPMGLESDWEISRLQHMFFRTIVNYMLLLEEKVSDLCGVGQ